MASNLGGVVQMTAAAWYMVSLTDSTIMIALVQSAATLPLMLFALLAGAVADLFEKRLQMIVALSFCTLASAALFVMTLLEATSPMTLLLFTFLIGSGTAFYTPAWQSSVIEIVSPSELSQAVSLNSLSYNLARSTGPAIGAEILAFGGVAAAFFVNAVSYIGLIAALTLWKKPPVERPLPRESLGRAMMDGLRFVGLSPAVRRLMFRGFLFAFGGASLLALPPIMVLEIGGGPRALGALLGGFGVGAMLGALATARLRLAMTANQVEVAATIVIILAMVVMAVSGTLWLSVPAMAIAGASWVSAVSTLNVSVQTSCPRWVAGRTLSILMMTFSFGIAGGSAAAGAIAGYADVFTALLLSAAFLGVTVLLARIVPIADAHLASLEPHEVLSQDSMPQVDPRTGPVVVTIDYRVPQANAHEFMTAMFQLRRVRRRDGARRWSLTQDVDDTELWLERFHSPTWTDYLHRISRRLAADRTVYQRVLDLCSESPIRHRRLERPAGSAPLGTAPLPERPTSTNL